MAKAETGLRQRILQTLRLDYPPSKGQVRVWGQPAGPASGAGHTDLFGVALGHPFALEIKLAKGRLEPTQITRIYDLRQCGTYAWAVRSEAEASRAVYWAKLGRRTPMPDEPIDFDDWFREVVKETPLTEAVNSVEPEPVISLAADRPLTEEEQAAARAAFEAGLEGAETSPGVLQAQADVRRIQSEPIPDDLAFLNEAAPVQRLDPDLPAPDIQDVVRGMSTQAAFERSMESAIQQEADADQNLAYNIEVTKAVGDRVTMVWEALGLQTTILKVLVAEALAQRQALVALLKEVGMEDVATTLEGQPEPQFPENGAAAAPAPRRRRRRVAATTDD